MTKVFTTLSAGVLLVGTSHAATVNLDLPAAGNYSATGTTSTTETISTAVTASTTVTIGTTGSFDILYTLGSIGGANSFVNSTGTQLGVGSDTDISNHYSTLEANDNEGISLVGLSVNNFVAGDSGFVASDITDLRFTGASFGNAGNASDAVLISFTDFGTATAAPVPNINDGAAGTKVVDLAALTNYPVSPALATDLYLETSGANFRNRWDVRQIQVAYTIPEPSSFALLLGGLGTLVLRRRRA
ncbi:MAG: PEP-CTERM sorting domain-containing protein [Roseibacillus sp.]